MFGFSKNNSKKYIKKNHYIGRHFKFRQEDKSKLISSLNKVIGQLETVKQDVETDNSCDDTLTQILAIRGGVASIGRNLIGRGVIDNIGDYSKPELELILKNFLKLD